MVESLGRLPDKLCTSLLHLLRVCASAWVSANGQFRPPVLHSSIALFIVSSACLSFSSLHCSLANGLCEATRSSDVAEPFPVLHSCDWGLNEGGWSIDHNGSATLFTYDTRCPGCYGSISFPSLVSSSVALLWGSMFHTRKGRWKKPALVDWKVQYQYKKSIFLMIHMFSS